MRTFRCHVHSYIKKSTVGKNKGNAVLPLRKEVSQKREIMFIEQCVKEAPAGTKSLFCGLAGRRVENSRSHSLAL